MSKDTQVVKAKPAEDQSWSGWKQYFADGFKYMREVFFSQYWKYCI